MNKSHINSAPKMPSDPTDFDVEPACSTWSGSIALSTSGSRFLVLVIRIVGGSLALGVDWVSSMELEEAIKYAVGNIVTDEKLTREEVGADTVLVALLDDGDKWLTFGLRLSHSLRDIENVLLVHN